MLILGLDPSSTSTGYGLVESAPGKLSYVDCGCFRPRSTASFDERIQEIYDGLVAILSAHRPKSVALENSFYGKDADAAAKLGEARGVLRLAIVQAGLEPTLYTPAEVKKGVVGNGQASKEQVQFMVANLLKMEELPKPLDASDALAVAVCHAHRAAHPMQQQTLARKPEIEALLKRVSTR